MDEKWEQALNDAWGRLPVDPTEYLKNLAPAVIADIAKYAMTKLKAEKYIKYADFLGKYGLAGAYFFMYIDQARKRYKELKETKSSTMYLPHSSKLDTVSGTKEISFGANRYYVSEIINNVDGMSTAIQEFFV